MDFSKIAVENGIKECLFDSFSEDALKFYTKNDIEEIENDFIPRSNLFFAKYQYDESNNYYTKNGNTIIYEYNGKKIELYEYKDCFIYYMFICNKKNKRFRIIDIRDCKELAENNIDTVYVYKDKYYCQYYEALNALLFFNRNEFLKAPSLNIIVDLKKPKSIEFISKYFEIRDGKAMQQEKINEFYVADDEEILNSFSVIYIKTMKKLMEKEYPQIYSKILKEDKDIIDNINFDEYGKLALEVYFLHGHEEFRNFCNGICNPEIYRKELLKDEDVSKNLKNNFWIYHEFESSLRDTNDDYVEGEDFTFLIINAIKSLEYLLYRKIKNYEEFKKIDNNSNISEKTMLDTLINYIEKHNEMFKVLNENVISKNNYDSFKREYIDLLYYIKNKCRNGYFHKDRIDGYDSLCKKRDLVLEAIAKTIIILK